MECTIGWVKLKEGFLLFKNRDRLAEEKINSNFIKKGKNLITFEDKRFKGCWLGINKYFGIATSFGPYRDTPNGYNSDNENFYINKQVLENAKSLNEASDLYTSLFLKNKIGKSYNVLIGDSNEAITIEFALDKFFAKRTKKPVARANSFKYMKKYNEKNEIFERSIARLGVIAKTINKIKCAEDVLPLLSYHSRNPLENICRHDYSVTIGSAVIEKSSNHVKIYNLLNKSPCKGKYIYDEVKLV